MTALIIIATYLALTVPLASLIGKRLRHARRQSQALQHAGEVVGEGFDVVHSGKASK